jgi:hypothetical protein
MYSESKDVSPFEFGQSRLTLRGKSYVGVASWLSPSGQFLALHHEASVTLGVYCSRDRAFSRPLESGSSVPTICYKEKPFFITWEMDDNRYHICFRDTQLFTHSRPKWEGVEKSLQTIFLFVLGPIRGILL